MDSKTIQNHMIMGLLYCRDENEDTSINKIMWEICFMEFEKMGRLYLNLGKNSTQKIFSQAIVTLAIGIRLNKIYFMEDDLHEVLRKIILNKMKEVKKERQKYSFIEWHLRQEAKLQKSLNQK